MRWSSHEKRESMRAKTRKITPILFLQGVKLWNKIVTQNFRHRYTDVGIVGDTEKYVNTDISYLVQGIYGHGMNFSAPKREFVKYLIWSSNNISGFPLQIFCCRFRCRHLDLRMSATLRNENGNDHGRGNGVCIRICNNDNWTCAKWGNKRVRQCASAEIMIEYNSSALWSLLRTKVLGHCVRLDQTCNPLVDKSYAGVSGNKPCLLIVSAWHHCAELNHISSGGAKLNPSSESERR